MAAPAVLRVVGAPGSGKTLLITSLTEALRQRGYRVASAVVRDGVMTVVTLPNGGRVTVERVLQLAALRDTVAALDARVDLLLAEGFEEGEAAAVVISPEALEAAGARAGEVLAVVSSAQVAGDFATFGPGETGGLVELVEARVLGRPVRSDLPRKRGGWLGRLRGRS